MAEEQNAPFATDDEQKKPAGSVSADTGIGEGSSLGAGIAGGSTGTEQGGPGEQYEEADDSLQRPEPVDSDDEELEEERQSTESGSGGSYGS